MPIISPKHKRTTLTLTTLAALSISVFACSGATIDANESQNEHGTSQLNVAARGAANPAKLPKITPTGKKGDKPIETAEPDDVSEPVIVTVGRKSKGNSLMSGGER